MRLFLGSLLYSHRRSVTSSLREVEKERAAAAAKQPREQCTDPLFRPSRPSDDPFSKITKKNINILFIPKTNDAAADEETREKTKNEATRVSFESKYHLYSNKIMMFDDKSHSRKDTMRLARSTPDQQTIESPAAADTARGGWRGPYEVEEREEVN